MEKIVEIFRVRKEVFEKDLETCLTIKSYPSKEKPYYTCVYISPSLRKKLVRITLI